MNVNGVNLLQSAIDSEHRILVLEKLIERILPHVPGHELTQEKVEEIKKEAIQELQKKYPEAGIEPKE